MSKIKTNLHPRNLHRNRYDFHDLANQFQDLKNFLIKNPLGELTIDYTNPLAVKALNAAILKRFYKLDWDIPPNFLCPPIPGRADYIHYLADILSDFHQGQIPLGNKITVLDIGCGANCIYPLLGHMIYGWNFIASDINPKALQSAKANINRNHLENHISVRMQNNPSKIFDDILSDKDAQIDITMCNPPFHSSAKEALFAAERKLKNLNIKTNTLNFGGQNQELYCNGGELSFIKNMITESRHTLSKCFTTLVSKKENLKPIYQVLDEVQAKTIKTVNMGQGQKKSRIVVWSF